MHLFRTPRAAVCKWNLCHEIPFSLCGCVPTWIKFTLTLFPLLTFSHTVFVLFTIFVFASLFYLLTLYNILLFFFFLSFSISLVFTTYYLFLRNQIELFLLYFFFHQVRRLLLSCFTLLFLRAAQCALVTSCDCVGVCVSEWERERAPLSRACFDGNGLFLSTSMAVCEWVVRWVISKIASFFLVSGKRD